MITVGMNYDIISGKEEEFEAVFSKVLGIMAKMPGHSQTSLFRNVDKPQCYLIHSEWNDRSAFDAFIASDQFKNVTDWGKREILAGRPKHEIYGASQALQPPAGPAQCPVGNH